MGLFRDHFRTVAAGHHIEVITRMTLWGSAEYVLLVDGMLGDLAQFSLLGMFQLSFGDRPLVLWTGRAALAAETPQQRRTAVTTRDRLTAQALSRSRKEVCAEVQEDEPFEITAEIVQGLATTNVRLFVNGIPCVMQCLA
jgi:hypothetical protein